MRKALALLFVVAGVVLFVSATTGQAAVLPVSNVLIKDFTDWESDPWGTGIPVKLTPKGSKVTIAADGATGYTWGGIYDDNITGTAIGMKATVNISAVSATNGNVQIGISNSLGMIDDQRVQASIMYEANNNNQYRIIWRIRSKDNTISNATWSTLASGTLSDLWISGRNLGTDMTFYFKHVKNGIMFGIIGTPYTVTWTSNKKMTAINYYPEIFGSAASGPNTIKGVIRNVYLLY